MGERADDDDNTYDISIKRTEHQHEQTNAHAQHTCKQANLALVGLPPWDLLEAVAEALREKALDVDEVFQRAVTCSNEFLCPEVEQSSREPAGAPCRFGIRTGCC